MHCYKCKNKIEKGNACHIHRTDGKHFIICEECYKESLQGDTIVLENFQPCEVYSRVCGFHTPISRWNKGKKSEWGDRLTYKVRE